MYNNEPIDYGDINIGEACGFQYALLAAKDEMGDQYHHISSSSNAN